MNPAEPHDLDRLLNSLFGEDGQTLISGDPLLDPEDMLKAQQGLDLVNKAAQQDRERQTAGSTATNFATAKFDLEDTLGIETDIQKQIGRFKIVRELGRGGFGVVLLALDPRLDRRVALKIPNGATLCNQEALSRFEREAQSAAVLGHPNIVPIYESGAFGPIRYIAFEYCQGESLAAWFKNNQRQIEPGLAAEIVATLADALQHAHAKNVVHRDLKPGNILIHPEAPNLVATLKITDFGLAKFASQSDSLTRTGATIGTPAYMSPEQARGDNDQVGVSSDIYSLGAILYELLTGQVPFTEQNNVKTLRAIELRAPNPPRNIRTGIHRDLQAICLKCLEKKTTDRYLNAKELQEDLRRYLDGDSVLARRPGLLQSTAKWIARNRAITLLASITVTSLLVGLLATWGQYQRAQSNLLATQENYLQARAAVDDLLEAAQDPSLAGLPKVRQQLLDRALKYYSWFLTQDQDDPQLQMDRIEAFRSVAKTAYQLGAYDQSFEAYADAQQLIDQLIDRASPWEQRLLKLDNQINIGLLHDQRKEFEKSIREYQRGVDYGELLFQERQRDPELRAIMGRAYKNLGYVYREQLNFDRAMVLYQKSLEIRESLVEEFPDNLEYKTRLAKACSTICEWHVEKRQRGEAFRFAERMLKLARHLSNERPDDLTLKILYARALNRLGDVHRNFGFPQDWSQQAIGNYEESLAICRKLADQYPLYVSPMHNWFNAVSNIGDVHRNAGQPNEAIKVYQNALAILERWGDANGTNLDFKMMLARLQHRTGQSYLALVNNESAWEDAHKEAREREKEDALDRARENAKDNAREAFEVSRLVLEEVLTKRPQYEAAQRLLTRVQNGMDEITPSEKPNKQQ